MYRSIYYLKSKRGDRPFRQSFVTYRRRAIYTRLSQFKLCFKFCWINLTLITPLFSCGIAPWHSTEQIPSEPVAYIRDGVFVSGEYIRSASIAEIDNQAVTKSNNNLIEITLGQHQVKIYCDEAKGQFNSLEFNGEAKILEFEAQIQRTYQVRCEPFSHWWIEDLENNNVVAGERFN